MNGPDISISIVTWAGQFDDLMFVRRAVFIEEQGVPEEIEIDDADPQCIHILATDATGKPVGVARLGTDGRIGRMAVLAQYRGRGIGTRILSAVIDLGRDRGITQFHLHSQVRAIEFYRKAGFEPSGEIFEEASIPHITMRLG